MFPVQSRAYVSTVASGLSDMFCKRIERMKKMAKYGLMLGWVSLLVKNALMKTDCELTRSLSQPASNLHSFAFSHSRW